MTGPTSVSSSTPYWLSVVAFDGEVHRLSVDSIRVYPLSELTPGGSSDGPGSDGESWFDQLVDGDLNTVIIMVSAIMVILGAALIIRPREKTAPQPWEMGTQEVEMEEEMTREAMGISEEEEIASSSILRQSQSEEGEPEEELSENPPEEAPEGPYRGPKRSPRGALEGPLRGPKGALGPRGALEGPGPYRGP